MKLFFQNAASFTVGGASTFHTTRLAPACITGNGSDLTAILGHLLDRLFTARVSWITKENVNGEGNHT